MCACIQNQNGILRKESSRVLWFYVISKIGFTNAMYTIAHVSLNFEILCVLYYMLTVGMVHGNG